MAQQRWRVRLGPAAEVDFANILKWTTENSGARQVRVYRDALVQALANGPNVRAPGPGTRSWQAFARFMLPGLAVADVISWTYRDAPNSTIEIVRIVHDGMDLRPHVPSVPDESTE